MSSHNKVTIKYLISYSILIFIAISVSDSIIIKFLKEIFNRDETSILGIFLKFKILNIPKLNLTNDSMDILILKMPKIYLNFFEIRYSQVIKYLRRK